MSYTINTILVPVDFSPLSQHALDTAIAISKRQFGSITLLHVVENTFAWSSPDVVGQPVATMLPEIIRNATENLNELARSIRVQHDIVVNQLVQTGNPADEICKTAASRDSSIVVMGAHGVSGWREFFLGSTAYRVVKHAPCPVMTIPGTSQWLAFNTILFPVRLVPNALDKYEIVRPVIRKNKSTLLVTGFVDPSEGKHSLDEMKQLVNSLNSKIKEDGVTCRSRVHISDTIAHDVLKVAQDESADLIVITATLDTSIREFFIGPYTQHIVNHARVPVLSIRPGSVESNTVIQTADVITRPIISTTSSYDMTLPTA